MTTCLVCAGRGPFPEIFSTDAGRLVRCPHCTLVFQDPQPTDEVLAETYYHDDEFTRFIEADFREVIVERARAHLDLLRQSGTVVDTPMLDVGCSSGAWLELVREHGWKGVGVEVGEATAEAARARDLEVHTGTLADAAAVLEPESFGLVSFWDVLEHVRRPREELRLARSLLRPGGHLVATMPNVEGWYPRVTYRLLARTTGYWEYPELPVHLYDFAPRTIRALLEDEGFTDVYVRTHPIPIWYYRMTRFPLFGGPRRRRLLRLAFEALRVPIYPAARRADRSNALFAVARRP
jgi:SAM-dependent methyltransferase